MIKKYSLYFANTAALVVFVAGLIQGITFSSLVIRTVITFFVCYYVALILGVITIETLLDSQIRKIEQRREKRRTEQKKKEG
ncbi:MAG: hypothetical protein PHF25_02190 [Candidatus Margulisbacteria bacterium]|nr:hypothetical protein [Candidatus Margulisiibacteriota bacterium]